MNSHACRAPLVAAALVFLFTTEAFAQAALTGPFAKVPAFPTACYTKNETFAAKLEAAQAAVQAENVKQTASTPRSRRTTRTSTRWRWRPACSNG